MEPVYMTLHVCILYQVYKVKDQDQDDVEGAL